MKPQPTVVGLGEVLWDLLPAGPMLGGAPANFACLAGQLGADAAVVSCVGQDDFGDQAVAAFQKRSVAHQYVGRNKRPTGTVEVTLDAFGQPSYNILTDVAWDYLEWSDAFSKLATSADAVCFGTLGQRSSISQKTIERFLIATNEDALRIFDVNLRTPYYEDEIIFQSLELANVLKLNDHELPILASICGFAGSEIEQMQQFALRYDLQAVALTCGAEGAKLIRGDEVCEQPSAAIEVVDTIGAGDAFAAALALGLLAGRNLTTISSNACRIAEYVCSQSGATPPLPNGFGY